MADTFTAVTPIYWNGVLAHMPGDEVPADNVLRHGWLEAGYVTGGTNTPEQPASDAETPSEDASDTPSAKSRRTRVN